MHGDEAVTVNVDAFSDGAVNYVNDQYRHRHLIALDLDVHIALERK